MRIFAAHIGSPFEWLKYGDSCDGYYQPFGGVGAEPPENSPEND